MSTMSTITQVLIVTLLFSIFVELYVGSISLRRNSENKLCFNPSSWIHFLLHPLHNSFLWNWETLIVNYPFVISIVLLINLILSSKSFYHNGISKTIDPHTTRDNLTASL